MSDTIVKLKDFIVADNIRNKDDEPIPVYSVTQDKGFCTGHFDKDTSGSDKTTYKIVPRGHFSYNPLRINVGSIGWQNVQDRVLISSRYVVFKLISDKIDPEYLIWLLKSDPYQRIIKSKCRGTVRPELTIYLLQDIKIKLIPVEKQKEMVYKLKQTKSLIEKYNCILEKMDQLVKARFIEIFGHQNQNEKGFKKSTIGESCIIRDSERIPVTSADREPGPYPYYGANGLQDHVKDYIFDGDFVLMAEDGGYFDDPNRPIAYSVSGKCWVNNHAHILQPGNELNVHYLEWALKYRDITNVIHGTTRSKLTQAAMRSISILVPPMELQEYFSQFLTQVDKSKFKITSQRDELIVSLKSLQETYFTI